MLIVILIVVRDNIDNRSACAEVPMARCTSARTAVGGLSRATPFPSSVFLSFCLSVFLSSFLYCFLSSRLAAFMSLLLCVFCLSVSFRVFPSFFLSVFPSGGILVCRFPVSDLALIYQIAQSFPASKHLTRTAIG